MLPRARVFAVVLLVSSTPVLAQTPPPRSVPAPPREAAWPPSAGAGASEPVASGPGVSGPGIFEPGTRTFRGAEPLPSFKSLFTGIGHDFARLPSMENAVILGLAGAASAAVHGQDRRITQSASGSAAMDGFFEPGALLGGGLVQVGGAFATFAIGRAFGSPRVSALGADLVRAQILTTAMTHGLKLAAGRTRPDGSRFSFPSGHSSATFATATVLQRHFGWKAGIPAYAFAGYIAGSRLQENKHYLSDVMFGAALGIAAGRTVTIGSGQARFALSPMPAPGGGGGGVGVTWAPNR